MFDKSAKPFDEMPHEDPFWRESKNLNLSSNVNTIHQREAGRKAHEESRRMTKD